MLEDTAALETAWQEVLEARRQFTERVAQIRGIRAERDALYDAPTSGDWEIIELLFTSEIKRLSEEARLARTAARTKFLSVVCHHYGWGTRVREEAFGYSLPKLGILFHYDKGVVEEENTKGENLA